MSYRNTDETTFHVLLGTLDESATENEIERVLLKEWQESFKIYSDCQEKRSVLDREIKNATGDHLRCLKDILRRTIERINLEDKVIVSLRKEPHLINLYEREKSKLLKKR